MAKYSNSCIKSSGSFIRRRSLFLINFCFHYSVVMFSFFGLFFCGKTKTKHYFIWLSTSQDCNTKDWPIICFCLLSLPLIRFFVFQMKTEDMILEKKNKTRNKKQKCKLLKFVLTIQVTSIWNYEIFWASSLLRLFYWFLCWSLFLCSRKKQSKRFWRKEKKTINWLLIVWNWN